MADAEPIETLLIDFSRIKLAEDAGTPEIVMIPDDGSFFINRSFCNDFRIRRRVFDMLKDAQRRLPGNYNFMLYEAYRPLSRQIELWNMAERIFTERNPGMDRQSLRALMETFVADPYNGIGSGHQAACAVDVSLCDDSGREYDMGCGCQEIFPRAPMMAEGLSVPAIENRKILRDVLETVGFAHYPAEWWHYSYGDHQWAFLKNRDTAIFGPLDLPPMAGDSAKRVQA